MLKHITRIFIILVLVLILLVSALLLFVYFNEQNIIRFAVNTLNEKIDTRITASKIDISVLRSFPDISLSLTDIKIESAASYKKQHPTSLNLLSANKLHIHFNLYQFLRKNFVIKGLTIEDGNVTILIDEKGNFNYKFWKTSNDAEEGSEVGLSFIYLNNIQIHYVDLLNFTHVSCLLNSFQAHGNISNIVLDAKSNLELNNFELKTKDLSFPLKEKLNLSAYIYFKNSNLTIKNIELHYKKLKVEGEFQYNKNLLVHIKTNSFPVTEPSDLIMKYLPEKTSLVDGNIALQWVYNGPISIDKGKSEISLDFNSCKVQFHSIPISLNGSIKTTYQNGFKNFEANQMVFSSKEAKLKVDGQYINKNLNAALKGELELKAISPFIDSMLCQNSQGQIDFDLHIKADNINNINDIDFTKLVCLGKINFNNVSGTINKNIHLNGMYDEFQFSEKDLKIHHSHGSINNNKFSSTLTISDLQNYFANKRPIKIEGSIDCDTIFPKQFLIHYSSDTSSFTQPVDLKLKITANSMHYDKIKLSHLAAQLNLKKTYLQISHINASICKGHIKDSNLDFDFTEGCQLNSDIKIKEVDIQELFTMFDNFGQHQLVAENVAGKISGTFQHTFEWNSSYEFLAGKMKGNATFELSDGKLVNYKPLSKLANYLEVDDINNIKFSTIKNVITINDNVLCIPEMDIQSNALNIHISGKHSFSNEYEYHFSVLLSDILLPKKKNKKRDSEFGIVEDEKPGKMRLFIKLSGKDDNFKIAYDNKKAMESFSVTMRKEKAGIKQMISQELSHTSDTIPEKKRVRIESEEFKKQENSQTKPSKKSKTSIEWKDE